jgi:prepilin-type N-terminal cleavage/methylation domain-containing protein
VIRLRHSRGDTLVEVVIALAILALTFVVAYNTANLSYRTGVQAREDGVAAQLIQDQAEKLRAYRDQLIAADALSAIPNDIFRVPGKFPPTMYMTSSGSTLQAVAGSSTSPAICFGLPTCTISVAITYPHPPPADPLLDEIQAVISVNWTSLIGNVNNTSQITYYLTDTRVVPTCDNSLAGTCS